MTEQHDTDGLNSNASESSSDRHRQRQPQKAKTRWWLVLVLVLTLIPAGALLWECTRQFFGPRREQPAGRPGEVSEDRETTGGLFTRGSGYRKDKEIIRALYRDKQVLIERSEELIDKLATLEEKQAESEEKQAELIALLDSKDAELVLLQVKIMALEDRGTKTEGIAETVKRLILLTERVTRLEEANRMLLEELAKGLEKQGKHAQAKKLREKLAEMRQRSSKTQPTTGPTTRKDAPLPAK